MIGTYETLVIFVVVILLFGPNRIPELAKTLGKASAEFRNAQKSFAQEIESYGINGERESRIRDVAAKMGIDTRNKNTDELLEIMRKKYKEEHMAETRSKDDAADSEKDA